MDRGRNYGYQSILSQDAAVGLIMALGNLGSNLEVRTYVYVHVGCHIYTQLNLYSMHTCFERCTVKVATQSLGCVPTHILD